MTSRTVSTVVNVLGVQRAVREGNQSQEQSRAQPRGGAGEGEAKLRLHLPR